LRRNSPATGDAVAEIMTEDVVSMPAGQPLLEGRDAWLAWVESQDFSVAELTAEAVEIDGRDGFAYLRVTYSEAFTVAGVAEAVEEVGKCVWVLRRQANGSWLVSTWICNSDLPLPAERSGTEE
jgi:ketosteroid isomerase-like protein